MTRPAAPEPESRPIPENNQQNQPTATDPAPAKPADYKATEGWGTSTPGAKSTIRKPARIVSDDALVKRLNRSLSSNEDNVIVKKLRGAYDRFDYKTGKWRFEWGGPGQGARFLVLFFGVNDDGTNSFHVFTRKELVRWAGGARVLLASDEVLVQEAA